MATSKYEAESGSIHKIQAALSTIAAAGAPPNGAVNSRIKAKISKTKREFGLRPRGVSLARTVGVFPDAFKKYRFLPILSKASANLPAYQNDAEITIEGITWTVVDFVPEDY